MGPAWCWGGHPWTLADGSSDWTEKGKKRLWVQRKSTLHCHASVWPWEEVTPGQGQRTSSASLHGTCQITDVFNAWKCLLRSVVALKRLVNSGKWGKIQISSLLASQSHWVREEVWMKKRNKRDTCSISRTASSEDLIYSLLISYFLRNHDDLVFSYVIYKKDYCWRNHHLGLLCYSNIVAYYLLVFSYIDCPGSLTGPW